jgi:hypothetical protein
MDNNYMQVFCDCEIPEPQEIFIKQTSMEWLGEKKISVGFICNKCKKAFAQKLTPKQVRESAATICKNLLIQKFGEGKAFSAGQSSLSREVLDWVWDQWIDAEIRYYEQYLDPPQSIRDTRDGQG